MNRAARRGRPKGSKNKQPAVPGSLAAQRQRASLNRPPNPPIGTSEAFSGASADQHDTPPADQQSGGSAAALGYRGKYGRLKNNIAATYAGIGMALGGPQSADGVLFLGAAVTCPDAWIDWGKADPRYMRVVEMFWGGPWMILIGAHIPLGVGLMANHNIRVPHLFNPFAGNLAALQRLRQQSAAGSDTSSSATPEFPSQGPAQSPYPYQPAGAYAPTEDAGPPPAVMTNDNLRVYPDEGLTSDEEVQIRNVARQNKVPYDQVRDAYLLARAQDRMAENGRASMPGALGQPVMKE